MKLTEISEGKAKILVPDPKEYAHPNHMPIFFNPRAKLSRDVSTMVLAVLRPKECLDGMCASGIRGIRYALESGIEKIFFNDISETAIALTKKNCEKNGIKGEFFCKDLNILLHEERFECIDIDPFGTPAPFLHSAACSVTHKGILLVTATDTSALCGAAPSAAKRKYHVVVKKPEWKEELSVRVLLGNLFTYLGIWEKSFKPVISFVHEHHVRVIVQVFKKPSLITKNAKNIGFYDGMGPLWLGELHNKEMCRKAMDIHGDYPKKAYKILDLASKEVNSVGYYNVHAISKQLGLNAPKISELIEKLREKGFLASRTVFSPLGVKTDADRAEVAEVIREIQGVP